MPWDMATSWKSTYNMLKFACIYHEVIDKITDDKPMNLRSYKLSDEEWGIVEGLVSQNSSNARVRVRI